MRIVALVLMCACTVEQPAPLPPMDRVALDGVGGQVRGTLGGRRFRVVDARFRIVDEPHRERVDLWLADRPLRRCGLPIARPRLAMLWARFPGRTELAPGEHELEGDVHFEREDLAFHRGVARIRIERASAESITGTMRACFAGASCVGGTFEARPCASRIDGRAIREPPGLDDEALEAVGARR